ncbi:MAG: porin family protein [Bacteroidetes bacterium]|nr:porin family protein [Bacteroidota bacterium]
MKKLLIIISVSFLAITVAEAQFTKAGGGLSYSTGVYFHNESVDVSHKTANPAIAFKGIYELSLPVHLSPSLNIFLPRVTEVFESKQTISAILLDVNAHYVFNSLDRFEFYALAGLNVTYLRSKWKYEFTPGDPQTDASSETIPGLNIGVGTYMKATEQLDVFGEFKYILSSRDQFILTAGVLLNLDWLKKNENKIF